MKHRRLLIGLALGVLATASIAVAAVAFLQRLPEPEQADDEGLLRWLVQTRLREQPLDLQMRLLNRMEEKLSSGSVDLAPCLTQIDADQTAQLIENVDLLAKRWFMRAADRYFSEPERKRTELVQQQAERVRQLGILDQVARLETNAAAVVENHATQTAHAESIGDVLNRWLKDVAPRERPRYGRYFSALRAALIWNTLEQWSSALVNFGHRR